LVVSSEQTSLKRFVVGPDFTVADLRAALAEFSRRERTRGALPQELAAENF